MKVGCLIKYIQSDLFRYQGEVSFFGGVSCYLNNPFFRHIFYIRLASSDFRILRIISTIQRRRVFKYSGIQISPVVKIGFGLYIPHGNVVVNSTAIIGNNCTLCQFSTIGSVRSKAATIKDNVYIGPNVSVVEDVTINNNVVIGAGSVVLKDISKNVIAAGVPCQTIKTYTGKNVINKNLYKY